MTPEEKAINLVEKFEFKVRDLDNEVSHTKDEAIQCAEICVDEKIKLLNDFCSKNGLLGVWYRNELLELREVKAELQKLK